MEDLNDELPLVVGKRILLMFFYVIYETTCLICLISGGSEHP